MTSPPPAFPLPREGRFLAVSGEFVAQDVEAETGVALPVEGQKKVRAGLKQSPPGSMT